MHLPQGKVLIRVNAINTCKAIISELIEKKIYKKSEILLLFSSMEIKNSNDYKNLAYNRTFFEKYKIVFTTAMIDEGLSIDQAGFTDVILIETDYNPRPEPIKQFFARFRNEDAKRKNYLYLRKKKSQIPTCFRPEVLFEKDLETLLYENDEDEANNVLTTYNNLFSNNNYYYKDANVNKFFIAYAATDVLFQKFNVAQFLDYLKRNYNLAFTINDRYVVTKIGTNEKDYKKKIKQQIAECWIDQNTQILQTLLYQSQDPYVFKAINKQPICVNEEIEMIAKDNIKQFEQLFLKTKELQRMGIDNTMEYLIEKDKNDAVTLVSDSKYSKRLAVLMVEKAIQEPKTNADKKTAQQFLHFAQWCELTGRFTHKQMYEELKKIGVLNYKVYKNEEMLFEILAKNFNLDVKRNKKTSLISCMNRGSI